MEFKILIKCKRNTTVVPHYEATIFGKPPESGIPAMRSPDLERWPSAVDT